MFIIFPTNCHMMPSWTIIIKRWNWYNRCRRITDHIIKFNLSSWSRWHSKSNLPITIYSILSIPTKQPTLCLIRSQSNPKFYCKITCSKIPICMITNNIIIICSIIKNRSCSKFENCKINCWCSSWSYRMTCCTTI